MKDVNHIALVAIDIVKANIFAVAIMALAAIMFVGCQMKRSAALATEGTQEGRMLPSGRKNVTETERFDASVRKELPFAVDSLR